MIKEGYMEEAMSCAMVFIWYKSSKMAVRTLKTMTALGDLQTTRTHENLVKVRELKTTFCVEFQAAYEQWKNSQQLLICNTLSRDVPLTSEEWMSLRQEILNSPGPLTVTTIDAAIMSQCVKQRLLNVGLSLLSYLESTTPGPNIATIGAFFKLWDACGGHKDEEEVLSRYENLRKQYPLLDTATCESAAVALSHTSRWEEILELLPMIKLISQPKSAVFTALAAAAFRHGNLTLGQSVLEETLENSDRRPGPEAYLAWIEYGDSEELLKFLASHGEVPVGDVALQLCKCLTSKGNYRGSLTSVTPRGRCQSCGRQLSADIPTTEEIQQLSSAMWDRVLLSGDVFLKTTPQELKQFQLMLKSSNHWDVVIDGLNVAFAQRLKDMNSKAKLLSQMVEYFWQQKKKILVVGRKHMEKWPKQHLNLISQRAQLFLAENISQDDPLFLLAALHSGLGTHIVSCDLLRSHMYLLKDKSLRNIFRRWQYSHQRFFNSSFNKQLLIKRPLSFHPFPQQHEDGSWHLPYQVITDGPTGRYNHLELPKHWLCLARV